MMIRTRIAEVAHARGLTVRELARRLKLYPSNLSLTDAGRRRPSLRLLARLAEALDCSPGELLTTASVPRLRSSRLGSKCFVPVTAVSHAGLN